MRYDMRRDPTIIAMDKALVGEFPVIMNDRPNVYMSWEDIRRRYPHCWVLLDEVQLTEQMAVIGGIVKHISYYREFEGVVCSVTHSNCLYMYTSKADGRRFSLFYGYE